jgi:hypothetical protein
VVVVESGVGAGVGGCDSSSIYLFEYLLTAKAYNTEALIKYNTKNTKLNNTNKMCRI